MVDVEALAADLVCWCNDLFSYGKENESGPDAHNLVSAIAVETGRDEPGGGGAPPPPPNHPHPVNAAPGGGRE
ncbi:terpene synthase family protein, partial [Micromonospora rubida]